MVDFNQPDMYAKSSSDLEQFSTMEARYNLLNAFETAEERSFNNTDPPLSVVKSRLMRLFRHVYDEYARSLGGVEKVEQAKKEIINAKSLEELDKAFRSLDTFMDDLGINRMDRQSLGGNIIKRNKAGGLL